MLRNARRLAPLAALALLHCSSSSNPSPSVAQGTVPLGSACRGYDECAPVTGKIIDCRCADGHPTPVCAAEAEAGESCAITGNFQPICRPGTHCVGEGSTTNATCRALAKAGEACMTTPGCEDPYWCDASGKCVLGQAGPGEMCDWLQPGSCAAPNVCAFPSSKCAAPSAIGQACERKGQFGRSGCVAGAGCNLQGMCAALQADGADCFDDEECASNVCFMGTCGRGSAPANVALGCGLP